MHYCVSFLVLQSYRRGRERAGYFALLLLSYGCLVTVKVLWFFLMVPCVGLQCVIVVFPDYAHFILFEYVRLWYEFGRSGCFLDTKEERNGDWPLVWFKDAVYFTSIHLIQLAHPNTHT